MSLTTIILPSKDGSVVKLRQKTATMGDNNDTDDNKSMRRISYLRATQGGTNDVGAFQMLDNDFDRSSLATAVNLSLTDGEEVETPNADTVNVQKP